MGMRLSWMITVVSLLVSSDVSTQTGQEHRVLAHYRDLLSNIPTIDCWVGRQTDRRDAGKRENEPSGGVRWHWLIDEHADLERLRVWQAVEGGEERLMQDKVYRKGGGIDYQPSRSRAEVYRPSRRLMVVDEGLLPFCLGRIIRSGSVTGVEEGQDYVELCWAVPDAREYERRITIRFAKDAPHDILTATFATDMGQVRKEASFRDYRPVGGGLRLPGTAVVLYKGLGSRPDAKVVATPDNVTVGREMLACEFVPDMEYGTVVNDTVLRTTYIVGQELTDLSSLSETLAVPAAGTIDDEMKQPRREGTDSPPNDNGLDEIGSRVDRSVCEGGASRWIWWLGGGAIVPCLSVFLWYAHKWRRKRRQQTSVVGQ